MQEPDEPVFCLFFPKKIRLLASKVLKKRWLPEILARPVYLSSLSTGYSISDQAKKIMDRGCQALIQKLFRVADLSQKIREVLDLRQSPSGT
jgi:hypothetical protein